ncbi:tetratricopeptide repeat protein [Kitasatospora sp. NPDC004669]|uniref:tetratricopeptide repeat protein n=1 Tax=Kitasatospora sp. NPDC004669 TaxID=3154555 RepID=UPI0033BE06CE
MERARLMGVTGPGGPGSGYAVGGRLVLTSAHVVARTDERVEVFRPGGDHAVGGVVVWCGTPGGRDDAALVLVDEGPWWQPLAGVVRWGRLVTDRPGTVCEGWGVPEVAQRSGAAVEAVQLTGVVNPGSGFVGNQYVMDLLQHPPQGSLAGSSPWGGLSGAAVFCGRLLTGVVASDRAYSGHGQLNVVPAYVLQHDPAFRTALAEHAGAASGLEAVEFQHLADPAPGTPWGGLRSPAALLQAGRQTVPFHGREDLIERMRAWCALGGFGAWLLHGPGGQGKTRLAHHLADLLAADRWAVLWPHPDATSAELREIRHTARPMLIVLDYAEIRAEQLTALIEAIADHPGTTPLKILLLARTAGDWWTHAKNITSLTQDYLDAARIHLLLPLEANPSNRREAYRQAVRALATALPHVHGYAEHDWPAMADTLTVPRLDLDAYGNALTLHMTALADLLDTAVPAAPTGGGAVRQAAEGVEDRLLGHEYRYWEQTATARGLVPRLTFDTLKTALAAAHLVGAADREQADQTWRSLPALADQTRDRRDAVTAWIAALYPATFEGRPWESLQPDRLAERHTGRILDADPALADHLLNDADHAQTGQLLTIYSRAAAHSVFQRRLDAHLTRLCTRNHRQLAGQIITTAVQTNHPAPLITALDAITADPTVTLDDLTTLNGWLPRSSRRLAESAVRLTQTITSHYRALAKVNPDAYLPDLATSLNNLSNRLGEVGRWEEGLAVIQQAVRIRNMLAETDPDAYLPDLATSLNNLSIRLGEMGRYEQGLAAIQAAVRIRRALAKVNPDAYLPDLATSLNNLSIRLGEMGRQQKGLDAIREAANHYRALAKLNPDAYLPDLAGALNNLSIRLGEMGRWEEGLAVAQEAADLYRSLVEANPDAFRSGLAHSLHNLSIRLGSVGRREEGLAAAQEAVRIRRALAEVNPDAYLPDLAGALINLSERLMALGRSEEALHPFQEALHIRRTYPKLFKTQQEWSSPPPVVMVGWMRTLHP